MIDFQFRPFEIRFYSKHPRNLSDSTQGCYPWMFSFYICAVSWREVQEWVLFSLALNETAGVSQRHAKVRLFIFNRLFEFGVTTKKESLNDLPRMR